MIIHLNCHRQFLTQLLENMFNVNPHAVTERWFGNGCRCPLSRNEHFNIWKSQQGRKSRKLLRDLHPCNCVKRSTTSRHPLAIGFFFY